MHAAIFHFRRFMTLWVLVGFSCAWAGAQAVRWDYVAHPVSVTENQPARAPVYGLEVSRAFDGYGAQGTKPAAVGSWEQYLQAGKSNSCEIDYGQPVAVTAFVHYFRVPGSRDLRSIAESPSAFREVRIACRDEATTWSEVAHLRDLPTGCPQLLAIENTRAARYWKIDVVQLAAGAGVITTYEIETYTGGLPALAAREWPAPDLPAQFTRRMQTHKPGSPLGHGELKLDADGKGLQFSVKNPAHSGKSPSSPQAQLKLLVDGQATQLEPSAGGGWALKDARGEFEITPEQTAMGLLLRTRFKARADAPSAYRRLAFALSAPHPELYYLPAYAWSREPVQVSINACNAQTRLTALGLAGGMLCLVPGTDRGTIGLSTDTLNTELLIGPEDTSTLISFVPGDWWAAYQFAVNDIYAFEPVQQTVPVSEMQFGISNYMLSDEVWEPALGTVRSWPDRDPHYELSGKGFDCFMTYGVPNSVPLYWARYTMNGDALARERMRSIVLWMCRSGVRRQSGPAKGAFFNLQRFLNGEERKLDKVGCTQASTAVMTSQSTGAALWTLLFYRKVTGESDPEINTVIDEATQWLLKTQGSDGGWPYGHDPDGKPVEGAPSSGAIWNIWALWRLGQETGDAQYTQAAERGTQWFEKTFIDMHHYHGYWEDVGPNSREGYDAGIAAVAFGEMGLKDLTVAAARDAMQWVFTRQIEPREASNSAGLVAEQPGWPPASYCNPMMALAASAAWKASGDDFWRAFNSIPKGIGWWYEPERGSLVWLVHSIQMAPIVGPTFESWWCDWTIAQPGTLMLRWLVREANRRGAGTVEVDEDTLRGTLLDKPVRAWAPPSGIRPILPLHGQVNWLGFQSEQSDAIFIVWLSDQSEGTVG